MNTKTIRTTLQVYSDDPHGHLLYAYNGFTIDFRNRVGSIQNAEFKAGRLTRPTCCMTCGGGGYIAAHLEDYLVPFDYLPLCYCCHRALHIRYKYPEFFKQYTDQIRAGFVPTQFPGYSRHAWKVFDDAYLRRDVSDWVGVWRSAGDARFFDALSVTYQIKCPPEFCISEGAGLFPGQHDGGRVVLEVNRQ